MKTGTAAKIREFAKTRSLFNTVDCREFTGVSGDAFWGVFKDFIKRNEIIAEGESYRYNTEYTKRRRGYVLYQVAKAMRISGKFCVDEIIMLTGADKSLVYRFVKECLSKGLLEIQAKLPSSHKKGCWINIYRVTDSDRFKKEAL